MKKTANLDAVPKKDSTAAESITLTSVDQHALRPALKPLVGSEDCRMSMSAKTVDGFAPCNPFYVKYADLFLNGAKPATPTFDISSLSEPIPSNLRDDLSSMHVVLHRRERAVKSRRNSHRATATCNPPGTVFGRLPSVILSNQYERKLNHGIVNKLQSNPGAPK